MTDEVESLESNNSPQIKKKCTKASPRNDEGGATPWYDFLKRLPVTVNRQKVIDHYIVDFYCASAKLAIELDGSQHYENEGAAADRERDHALNQRGITILRYSNNDLNRNFDGVCADLLRRLGLTGIE